jgi:hypothetical protein
MAARKESLALLGVLILMGCRGTPKPVARAAEAPPAASPAPVAPPAAQPSTPAPAPAATPSRDGDPVVVESGDDESTAPKTLVQAARAERERRATAGKPVAVITDKNLHQYAAKGQLTVADPKEKKKPAVEAAATPAPAAAPSSADPAVRDEQYWRSHALEIRLRWRSAADEVKRLEQRSTELRQRFYSENDSFVRDNQVKPEWDRVVDRLRQARADADSARVELAAFLEEGRRANALPGWLREGEDQEPPTEPLKKKERLPAPQSIEPPVLGEEPDNRPPGDGR